MRYTDSVMSKDMIKKVMKAGNPVVPNKVPKEKQQDYINKYKFLLEANDSKYKKKFTTYSKEQQCRSLYVKFHYIKRMMVQNCMAEVACSKSIQNFSMVDIIDHEIDVLSLSINDLTRLSLLLPRLTEDVAIALDLKNEEQKHLEEMKNQLHSLDEQRKALAKTIHNIQKIA